jgi:hypothetical protein
MSIVVVWEYLMGLLKSIRLLLLVCACPVEVPVPFVGPNIGSLFELDKAALFGQAKIMRELDDILGVDWLQWLPERIGDAFGGFLTPDTKFREMFAKGVDNPSKAFDI